MSSFRNKSELSEHESLPRLILVIIWKLVIVDRLGSSCLILFSCGLGVFDVDALVINFSHVHWVDIAVLAKARILHRRTLLENRWLPDASSDR